MRLLKEADAEFTYREYTKEPLTADEVRPTLAMLGVSPRDVLRKNDKAYKALSWIGDEDDDTIIGRMADHPTLLQRPIAIKDGKAALGRPASNILQLLD